MTILTAAALVALNATTLAPDLLPAELAIGTDTRDIAPGSTFLALRGENFEGHAFVADAFARGAACCIVADAGCVPAGRPAIVVADTLRAYLALARLARDRVAGTVIAISGSAGKTTTKAFLVQLLAAAGIGVAGTPENENNEVGVSKFFVGLPAGDTRTMVVEMGARHNGDIDVLVAAAQPDVAVLTNIGEAHLEIFGTREQLANTKWGLFRAGARPVLNLDDAVSRARAALLDVAPVWFGIDDDTPPPSGETSVVLQDARTLLVTTRGGRVAFPVDVGVPGDHNRRNLAAALAAAVVAGHAPATLAPYVGALRLPPKRYESVAISGGRRLIFDAYNASMTGTLATLAAFAHEVAPRRIAVLGSMAELGAESPAMHRRVGAAAAEASSIVLAGGEFAGEIVRGATAAGADATRVIPYADNAAAIAWLERNARSGDVILLKGSRKYAMEQIAAALGGPDVS